MHSWYLYLVLPLLGAALGYVTKLVAIEMMFRPARFIGIPPVLGWQGIVPRHAERMAMVSAELLTTRLIHPSDIFTRIDSTELAARLEQPMLAAVDEITRDVLRRYHPRLWDALPALMQDMVVKQVQSAAPAMVEQLIADLRTDVTGALDVRSLVITALGQDETLVPRLVRQLSRPEMRFIARCGLWSGLALGLLQTLVWAMTGQGWVLVVFGASIGLFTDWLAIKLVFFPREPMRVLGLTVQGVFQRRRDQVAVQYGDLIAHSVITVPTLLDGVLRGPQSGPRVVAAVEHMVHRVVTEQTELARPMLRLSSNQGQLTEMTQAATVAAMRRLPETAEHAHSYLTGAMDLARTITARMRRLNRIEYEALLRPAFRQDEWKLIAVGATIGAIAGLLQALALR